MFFKGTTCHLQTFCFTTALYTSTAAFSVAKNLGGFCVAPGQRKPSTSCCCRRQLHDCHDGNRADVPKNPQVGWGKTGGMKSYPGYIGIKIRPFCKDSRPFCKDPVITQSGWPMGTMSPLVGEMMNCSTDCPKLHLIYNCFLLRQSNYTPVN